MLSLLDQLWFLLAFIGGLAGFFGVAGFLADIWVARGERRRVARGQAIRVTQPSWMS